MQKHIAPDLFLSGNASISGLNTTSTKPPPTAISAVATRIPANGGITNGRTPSDISPRAEKP